MSRRSSLDARIAAARGEHDRAIKFWQQAAAAADQLPYDEPPVWFYPVRESLGAALLPQGATRTPSGCSAKIS